MPIKLTEEQRKGLLDNIFKYGTNTETIKFGEFEERNGHNYLPLEVFMKTVGSCDVRKIYLSEWDVMEISSYLDAQREKLYEYVTPLSLLNGMEESNELWNLHLIIIRKYGKILVNEKIDEFHESEKDLPMYQDEFVDKTETVGNILIVDVLEK